jgi:hypothetical protein
MSSNPSARTELSALAESFTFPVDPFSIHGENLAYFAAFIGGVTVVLPLGKVIWK